MPPPNAWVNPPSMTRRGGSQGQPPNRSSNQPNGTGSNVPGPDAGLGLNNLGLAENLAESVLVERTRRTKKLAELETSFSRLAMVSVHRLVMDPLPFLVISMLQGGNVLSSVFMLGCE